MIYRGTKVYFIRSPHPHLCRFSPSGHASPLGYFDRVIFFNYKPSSGRGEPGTWVAGQTGKSKEIDKKLVRGFPGGGCDWKT
jgi:hypothetical protein